MAPSLSEVEICNKALSLCGERRISSLNGADNASQVCAMWYDDTRQSVSRNFVWNCLKTVGTAARIYSSTAAISGISKASPGVITTSSAHGLTSGMLVYISGVEGMTEINGQYLVVTVTSSTTFSIGIDTTSYTTYTGGGTLSLPSADYTDAYQAPSDCLRLLSIEGEREIYQRSKFDFRQRVIYYDGGGANIIKVRYVADVEDISKWEPLFKDVVVHQLACNIAYGITKSEKVVARCNQLLSVVLQDAVAVDGMERPPERYEPSKLLQSRGVNDTLVDAGIYMDWE